MAVAGVANKESDYDESDIRQLTLLMDAVWRITEEKKSAEALLRSEGKYRNIVDNAQKGIFQATAEGRYLTVNKAMAAMLGYASPEDLMTPDIDIAQQIYLNPEDRAHLLRLVDEHDSVKGFECQFRRKDGSLMWVSVNLHAIRDKDSRILSVADVVESMASYRPYRPALGIEAALGKIESHKGTLYDTDVVDSCLRLFRKKGFILT